MQFTVIKIVLLVLSLALVDSSFALGHQCGADKIDGVEYKWCIDQAPESREVLYYLHGAGRNEAAWSQSDDTALIQRQWLARKAQPPTVITVTFGPLWMLTEAARAKSPALYPLFVKKIMPRLEAKIGGVQGRRLLKSESMGGFNASQLVLKNPELFSRVVLSCPAIASLSPYASQAEIDAFLDRNKEFIDRNLVWQLLEWARLEFPSEADWRRHSPLLLAEGVGRDFPAIYLSCGDRDQFGFFEGVAKFADTLKHRGAAVTWESLPGGHCVENAKAIADFLLPPAR